jgi:antitoxin VapB
MDIQKDSLMNASRPVRKPLTDTKTTTVFVSGNSQAVRLPKEFRVNSKIVEIFKRGDEIVLRERPRTVGDALAEFPSLSSAAAADIDVMMKNVKTSQPSLEDRDFSWMGSVPARKTKPKATRSK